MIRSPVLSTLVVFSLVCALLLPAPAQGGFLDFGTDTLKSTGIIIGITAGVVLLVVLIAGTIKDIKGTDEEEEDIWADLRKNRTLSHFPSLFAGPDLLDGMRATIRPQPAESPELPSWALPSCDAGAETTLSHAEHCCNEPPGGSIREPAPAGRTLADARWISLNPSDPLNNDRFRDETSR